MKPLAPPPASGPVVPPPQPPVQTRVRRRYGVVVFWCVFVFLFTVIFYLGYLVLLSVHDSADREQREDPASEVAENREPELATPVDSHKPVAPSKRAKPKPKSTPGAKPEDAPTEEASEPGHSVSPFADVFSQESDASADASLPTLLKWRDKLRAGLDELDALSESDRRAFGVFAQETLDYASFHEQSAQASERATLSELRSLASQAVKRLGERSQAKPLLKDDYLRSPFDDTTERIPVGFMGHDIEEVATALSSESAIAVPPQRDGGARAYEERLERIEREASDVKLFGSVTYGSRLAFVLPNFAARGSSGVDSVEIEYSPSRKSATILKSEFSNEVALYRRIIPNFGSRRDEIPTLTFTPGSCEDNKVRPFGVKYEVDGQRPSAQVRLYGLALKSDKKFRESAFSEFRLRLNRVPRAKGEELERHGRVLCVCTLSASGTNGQYSLRVANGRMRGGAGEELYKQTDYLLTVVDCEFWLYDEQTGEILAKYSCDDALGGKALPYEGEDDN